MPKLQKIPDKLTFGEYQEWLKQNPDHPKAKEYAKKWGEVFKNFKNPLPVPYIRPESSYLAEQTGLLRAIVEQNQEKVAPDEISYKYNKTSHSLIIRKVDEIAINFTDKRGNNQMLNFFEVLEECLEEKGQINGKYIEVPISISELIKKLSKRGVKNINKDWLISARSNFLNSKIVPVRAEDYIFISEFNDDINGYVYKRRILP